MDKNWKWLSVQHGLTLCGQRYRWKTSIKRKILRVMVGYQNYSESSSPSTMLLEIVKTILPFLFYIVFYSIE